MENLKNYINNSWNWVKTLFISIPIIYRLGQVTLLPIFGILCVVVFFGFIYLFMLSFLITGIIEIALLIPFCLWWILTGKFHSGKLMEWFFNLPIVRMLGNDY